MGVARCSARPSPHPGRVCPPALPIIFLSEDLWALRMGGGAMRLVGIWFGG